MKNYLFVQEFDLPDFVMVGSIHRESDDELVKYVPEKTCHAIKKGKDNIPIIQCCCSECYRQMMPFFNFCPHCGAKVVSE